MIRFKQKNIALLAPNKSVNYVWQQINQSGLDPDTLAFINAAGITDPTITTAVDTLVTDLKGYGIWTKMKAIYPFVGGTATTHKFNLKNPADTNAAFRLVFSGGITHSSNGVLPNGTNGFAETYLANNLMSQNSVHASFYSRTNLDANRCDLSSRDGGSQGVDLYFRRNGATQITINSNTRVLQSVSDSLGLILASRTGPTTSFVQKNSAQYTNAIASDTNVSATFKFFVIGNFGTDWGARECAFASIGDGLSQAEASNLYTAVQAFQTTLGRQV